MTLDRTSSVPLYHQLLEIFNEFLTNGIWKVGNRIPTEEELATTYGVSKITVKQALSILAREGRIERRPGKGTFVIDPRYEHILPMSPSLNEYLPSGNRTSAELLEWKRVTPTVEVQRRLHSFPHEEVFLLRRLILSGKTPIAFQSVFYPDRSPDGVGSLSREDVLKISLLHVFGDFTHLEETLEPVALDGYEAKLLRLRIGTPAIMLERTVLARETPLAFERFLVARGKIKLDRFVLTTGSLEVLDQRVSP